MVSVNVKSTTGQPVSLLFIVLSHAGSCPAPYSPAGVPASSRNKTVGVPALLPVVSRPNGYTRSISGFDGIHAAAGQPEGAGRRQAILCDVRSVSSTQTGGRA